MFNINTVKSPDDILQLTSTIKYDNITDDVKYKIKTPYVLLSSKLGICYDIVELERFAFTKLNYKFKTYFFYENLPLDKYLTHTALLFEENKKYYWFESSWESYRTIHGPFKSYDDGILYITNTLKKSNKWKSVYYKNYKLFNYEGMNILQFGEHILNIKMAKIFFLPKSTRPKDLPTIHIPGDYWHTGIIYNDYVYETFNFSKWSITNIKDKQNELDNQNAIYINHKILVNKLNDQIKSGTSCGTYVARVLGIDNTTGSIKTLYPSQVFKKILNS